MEGSPETLYKDFNFESPSLGLYGLVLTTPKQKVILEA
jgi:hypothetical protein